MSCVYTYQGKQYTEEEYKKYVVEQGMTEDFRSGEVYSDMIDIDRKKYQIQFDENGKIIDEQVKGKSSNTVLRNTNGKVYGFIPTEKMFSPLSRNRYNRISQQKFGVILSKLKSTFPQLNFIEESGSSMEENGYNKFFPGYVDEKGIHYNIDQVTEELPFHEMQHIWNEIIKIENPKLYQQMYDFIKKKIDTKDSDYESLKDLIVENNSSLKDNEEKLIDEMMATIGGLRSKNSVRNLFLNNGSDKADNWNMMRTIWEGVKGFVRDIMDTLHGVFFPGKFSPDFMNRNDYMFRSFFDDMRNTVLDGSTPFKFTEEELETIKHTFGQYYEMGSVEVNNISDIVSILNTKNTDPTKMMNLNEDALQDYVFSVMMNQKGKFYKWKIGETEKKYSKEQYELEPEALKKVIRKDIVSMYSMFEKSIRPKMSLFIKAVNEHISTHGTNNQQETLVQIADTIFGKTRLKDRVLRELSVVLGMQYSIREIVPYRELYAHSDANIRALYNNDFDGFDPLVIIHETDNNNTDISILDITSKPLGEFSGSVHANNIFSDLLSDGEYLSRGGSVRWGAKAFNIRNLVLTLQMMAMKKSNPKMRIRNIGTIEIHSDTMKGHMIIDISDALRHVGILTTIPAFMDSIKSDHIRSVLEDKSLFLDNYGQSWCSQLNSYIRHLAEQLDELNPGVYGIKTVAQKQADTLFSDDVNPRDILKIYRKRQKDIENRLGKEEAFKDSEYRLISNAIRELREEGNFHANSLEDMSIIARKFLNSYNINSEILQWVLQEAQVARSMIVDKYIKIHKEIRGDLEKIRIQYLKDNTAAVVTQTLRDKGSDYFKDSFITVRAKLLKDTKIGNKTIPAGEYIDMISPKMAMGLKEEGVSKNITDDRINLNNKLWEKIRDRWIDNIYYDLVGNPNNLDEVGDPIKTREYAAKIFDDLAEEGMVPVIEKAVNELLTSGDISRGGDIGMAIEKSIRIAGRESEFFDDMLGKKTDEEFAQVHAKFSGQRDKVARYEKAGLRYNEISQEYEVLDYERNKFMSTNLERIFNYFMLDGLRTEIYGERLIPVINNANSLLLNLKDNGIKQEQNIKYLEEFSDKVLLRKNRDEKHELKGRILGKEIRASVIVRNIIHGYSMAVLFLKTSVAAKSAGYNEIHQAITSISTKIANIGVPPELKDNMPNPNSAIKAHSVFGKDFRKARLMALHFQLINRSERDLLESPTLNMAIRNNIFTEGTGYIMSAATDMGARILAMAAWMHQEGSWDAYSFDKKTGEIQYDPTKDKRFYNADGTHTPQQESLLKSLIKRHIDQETMVDENSPIPSGHDWQLVTNNLKWYADKWIIGGVDDMTKVMLANSYIGAMFTEFRMFSFDPLFNMGLAAGERKTYGGGKYVAKDSNGEMLTEFEKRDIEGAFQSLNSGLQDLLSLRKIPMKDWKSFHQWWKDQSPQRRFNLANVMVRSFAWLGMFMLVRGLMNAGMADKKMDKKLAWMMSDIVFISSMMDWMQNPIPLASGILAMYKITSGEQSLDKITRFTGGVGEAYKTFLEEEKP